MLRYLEETITLYIICEKLSPLPSQFSALPCVPHEKKISVFVYTLMLALLCSEILWNKQ